MELKNDKSLNKKLNSFDKLLYFLEKKSNNFEAI